jgi:hypothetical protein
MLWYMTKQLGLQHWFYNLVDPAQVGQYQTKPSGSNIDQAKWEKAMRDNPDPTW